MKISILVDNPGSWMVPYAKELTEELRKRGHTAAYFEHAEDIPAGDIACFLSCERIMPPEIRARNSHNLVVHESGLPYGKGWSPLTWQILEGKNDVPVTLFEAADEVDAGDIFGQQTIHFTGGELLDEMRKQQADVTKALILEFVDAYPDRKARTQNGEETFYRRRRPEDSELDPSKSILELFNCLRVADNDRYPAFFSHKGRVYVLKIFPKE